MASPNEMSFLPDGYAERKAQRRMNAVCALLFTVAIGGIIGAGVLNDKANQRVASEWSAIEEQFINEARRIDQVREMQAKQKRMAHQAELTASLLEKVPRSNMLAELTNSLPAGVSLLDMDMTSKVRPKPAPVEPARPQELKRSQANKEPQAPPLPEPRLYDVGLKLTGVAVTDVQVAQFLSKLQKSPLFQDVNLVISEQYTQGLEKGQEPLRKFQIEMTLNRDADVHKLAQPTNTAAVELKPE